MDLSISANLTSKSAPSFGRINLLGGSSSVLKGVLNADDWREFQKIIQKYNYDEEGVAKAAMGTVDVVDINFFGKGKKSLEANIISNNRFVSSKHKSQRFYQSVMGFIKKCCKACDKMQAKVDKVKDIDVDDILRLVD